MVKYHRWRLRTRNAEPGDDVVIVRDKEGPKGKFTLGITASVKKDEDNIVRKVTVKYKLAQPKDQVDYQAKPYKYAERNVRGLALVVTAQEREEVEGVDVDKIRFDKNIEVSDDENQDQEENQTKTDVVFDKNIQSNDDHISEDDVEHNENDDKFNENDDQFNENDDQSNENEDQVKPIEVNVEDKSNSNLEERKLPATSTGRKRWKPNKLDL